MKLLIVTPYFYPTTGGLETYAYNIAKGLKKKFHWKIVVITSQHQGKKNTKEKLDGMTIYRLRPLLRLSNTPINPFWYFAIKQILHKEKPDVINAHAPVPFIADITAAVCGNIPFVLTYHAGTMKKGNIFLDIIINVYEKLFLRQLFKRANKIICASEFVKKGIAKKYQSKSTVITPAVDTTIFKTSSERRIKNSVLFVGRYANVYKLKGLEYLLEAVKNLPAVSLRIVGEKNKTVLKNVNFIGIKSGKALAHEMQKSNLLVLPSIAPMESFGMVLIEAMACGTPVIGTRMGGIPEIITHGENGLIVPPKDAASLKRAITEILTNVHKENHMRKAGLHAIQKQYLWKYKVDSTNTIFINLLK